MAESTCQSRSVRHGILRPPKEDEAVGYQENADPHLRRVGRLGQRKEHGNIRRHKADGNERDEEERAKTEVGLDEEEWGDATVGKVGDGFEDDETTLEVVEVAPHCGDVSKEGEDRVHGVYRECL